MDHMMNALTENRSVNGSGDTRLKRISVYLGSDFVFFFQLELPLF